MILKLYSIWQFLVCFKWIFYFFLLKTHILGITGCITLYSFGYLTNNFIGYIYLNREKQLLKIAYIDFWGRRKDIVSPITDFHMKNTKLTNSQHIFGSTLVKKSTGQALRINLRFGLVLDDDFYIILNEH